MEDDDSRDELMEDYEDDDHELAEIDEGDEVEDQKMPDFLEFHNIKDQVKENTDQIHALEKKLKKKQNRLVQIESDVKVASPYQTINVKYKFIKGIKKKILLFFFLTIHQYKAPLPAMIGLGSIDQSPRKNPNPNYFGNGLAVTLKGTLPSRFHATRLASLNSVFSLENFHTIRLQRAHPSLYKNDRSQLLFFFSIPFVCFCFDECIIFYIVKMENY